MAGTATMVGVSSGIPGPRLPLLAFEPQSFERRSLIDLSISFHIDTEQ